MVPAHLHRYFTVDVALFQLIDHKKPRRLVLTHVYRYLTVHVVLFQLISPGDWSRLMCTGISYCTCCIASADWPQEAHETGPCSCVQVSYCACMLHCFS